MAFDRERPPLDWKPAQWLLPYLIGMGIISWLGQFPLKGDGGAPPINTFHIPSWWDYLIVAAFSLVIYFWAMAARLPREQMQERVARQTRQDDLPDTGLHH
jgi:ABC-type dipeptide/oligopeptide/nickel transport system permease component